MLLEYICGLKCSNLLQIVCALNARQQKTHTHRLEWNKIRNIYDLIVWVWKQNVICKKAVKISFYCNTSYGIEFFEYLVSFAGSVRCHTNVAAAHIVQAMPTSPQTALFKLDPLISFLIFFPLPIFHILASHLTQSQSIKVITKNNQILISFQANDLKKRCGNQRW